MKSSNYSNISNLSLAITKALNAGVHANCKNFWYKGLLIVGVADNDSRPEDWKQAIKQDGIGEFRHVLRGLRRTADGGFDRSQDLSENFGNSVLPTKYLIDRNGIILLRVTGTDKTELDAKLKEIFG